MHALRWQLKRPCYKHNMQTTTNNTTQSLAQFFWASFPCELFKSLQTLPPQEQARAQIDLAFVSSLIAVVDSLDWKLKHHGTQLDGLQALNTATTHMFLKGSFSSAEHPLQADSLGLFNLTQSELQQAFQVHLFNPLAGMAQRTALVHTLADTLHQNESSFGPQLAKRPSDMLQHHALFQEPTKPLPLEPTLSTLMAKNFAPELHIPATLAHLLVSPLEKLGLSVDPHTSAPQLWYT